MTYTANQIREKAQYYGEFMLVLEIDGEYDFHNFTVTFGEDESSPALSDDEIRIEGVMDGEHLVVDIPIERIEHVYAHREL